jgi:hypothetical protein
MKSHSLTPSTPHARPGAPHGEASGSRRAAPPSVGPWGRQHGANARTGAAWKALITATSEFDPASSAVAAGDISPR